MRICVTSASGIEAVLKRELFKLLNLKDLPAINGRIEFDGSIEDIAKLNLHLGSCNRVYIVLAKFKAFTFDQLYDGIYSIDWKKHIAPNGYTHIKGKSYLSTLFAVSSCQSITKKAICEKLLKQYNLTELNEDGARYKIDISILNDEVTVMIDTSGAGLHRRGYRGLVGEAPLKETLAFALLDLSVWNGSRPFLDPFCGSGTIPIEATMRALKIPPGLNRNFDFMYWSESNFQLMEKLKQEARDKIEWDTPLKIYAFDIDEDQIKLARTHAELAGVADYIHFQRMDMAEFTTKLKRGVIITNPPYGERLMNESDELEDLYVSYGNMFRNLNDWCAYTITSVEDFEYLFRKRADKKRKIYNGKIECVYYSILGKKPVKQGDKVIYVSTKEKPKYGNKNKKPYKN